MNAPALALPPALPAQGLPMSAANAAATAALTLALAPAAGAPAAGLALTKATCVAQTTLLLRAACQRGQLEDAAAAARIALPLAQPRSPHQALLQALAQAQPRMMQAPDENRLYLLRGPDGTLQGLLRLRDNGRISYRPQQPGAGASTSHLAIDTSRWALVHGQLVLSNGNSQTSARFALCGAQGSEATGTNTTTGTSATDTGSSDNTDQRGLRIYLGQAAAAQLPPQEMSPTFPPPGGKQSGQATFACEGGGPPLVLQEVLCTYTRLSLLDDELVDPFFGLYDIDAMVPATLPDRAALVLAAPHSGAARLVAALNRCSSVLIDGELLHPHGVAPSAAAPLPPVADALLQARSKDPAWFARMMLRRSHDALGTNLAAVPVRGFTLAPQHSRTALDWAINEPGLRIVHLARSNLLAEFADILAAQTGASSSLSFEPERFLRFVDMQQRYLAALRERLVQRQADTVEIDASNLHPALLDELLGFLTDLPAAQRQSTTGAPPAAGLVATSTAPVLDRFDNPAAVLACLVSLGRPDWADAEWRLGDTV